MKKEVWLLFLVCCSLVVSAETKIFEGDVESDQILMVQNQSFQLSLLDDLRRVFVQTPTGSPIVVDGLTCESNQYFEVCISKTEFSHFDAQLYRDVYTLTATISAIDPKVNVEIQLYTSNFSIGDSTTVTVSVENLDRNTLSAYNLSVRFPGFLVYNAQNCRIQNNELTYLGELQAKSKRSCSFSVLAQEEGNHEVKATVSLPLGLSSQQVLENTTVVVHQNPLAVKRTLPSTVYVGDDITVEYMFANNYGNTILLSQFTLESEGAQIWSEEGEVSNNVFSFSDSLEVGEQKNLSLKLSPSSPGIVQLTEHQRYLLGVVEERFEAQHVIEVLEPKPFVEFIVSPQQGLAGQRAVAIVRVSNPTRNTSFSSLFLSVHSSQFSLSDRLNVLDPQDNNTLIRYFFTLDTSLDLALQLNYTSSQGDDTFEQQELIEVVGELQIAHNESTIESLEEELGNTQTTTITTREGTFGGSGRYEGFDLNQIDYAQIEDIELEEYTPIPLFPTIYFIFGFTAFVFMFSLSYLYGKRKEEKERLYEVDKLKITGNKKW